MTDKEIATIAARALHTLETLRDAGKIKNDDSIAATFVLQSVDDLRRLADAMEGRGVELREIDIGNYVGGVDCDEGSAEAQALTAWNLGLPINSLAQANFLAGRPILVVKR